MAFDIRTMVLCDIAIIIFMSFVLLFYWMKQKTYPGFGFWVAGFFILASVYIVGVLLRTSLPEYISIVLTNVGSILTAIVMLDGFFRFMRGQKLAKIYYGTPLLTIPFFSYFYFIDNNFVLRNLFLAIFVFITVYFTVFCLLRYSPPGNKTPYIAYAVFSMAFSLNQLIRAFVWLFSPPQNMFDPDIFNFTSFLIMILAAVGWGLSYLMMNSQRLEQELRVSEKNLQTTVNDLQNAFSEIKTLSGFLPICASCKKIRDDKGYWQQIESYITQHTGALFSHGICPECIEKLYPEYADSLKNKIDSDKQP